MHYVNMEMDKSHQVAQELQKAFILTFEKDLAAMIFIFFCFFVQSGDDFFKRQDPSNISINECNNDQTDVVLESYCISYSPLLIVSSFEVSPLWYSLAPCETHLQSISIFISDTSQAFIVEALQVLDRQNQIQLQITRDQEVAQMHLIRFQPFQSRLAQPE